MGRADIDVVTKALRDEARMWDKQSAVLDGVHHKVEGLRLTRIEAGIFQVVFNAYERVVNHISQLTLEGRDRTNEISDALYENAQAYDNGEEEVTQTVNGAY